MELDVTTTGAPRIRTGCLVAGAFEGKDTTSTYRSLDAASGGKLGTIVRKAKFRAGVGRHLRIHALDGVTADSVLVVGCGPKDATTPAQYRKIARAAARAVAGTGARSAAWSLGEVDVDGRDLEWKSRIAVECLGGAAYRFDAMRSKADDERIPPPGRISIAVARAHRGEAAAGVETGQAIAAGVSLARDLGNLPGNVCTPTYLADEAGALARRHPKVTFKALDEARMKRLGMGSLLSVARGSREPPRLVILEYRGAPRPQAPIVLVGKGVTFDSGGISIKPSATMDEMKFDMCGAASVIGAMEACATLGLPLNVVALAPACENLPDGNASKPGDVVRTMAGKTVEVLNTDAEGRLILCDALTYAGRYKPDVVIDVATLTGACVIALGAHASGLFSNHQPLADALLAAGEHAGDRAWQMPLFEEYAEQLESNFADFANVGGREAGAVTAASFLAKFASEQRWAHLDVAGTAWRSGKEKGATGRPVGLLCQYLLDRARAGDRAQAPRPTKHAYIREMIDAGHSDADIIGSTTRWSIRKADIRWNRKHYTAATPAA